MSSLGPRKDFNDGAAFDPAVAAQLKNGLSGLQALIVTGQKDAVKDALLLEAKDVAAIINYEDPRGKTALHYAIEAGWDDMIAPLVAAGADPLASDSIGSSPLMDALEKSDQARLLSFLQGGMKVDLRDEDMPTPLQRAIEDKNLSLVNFLLEQGADVALTTPEKKDKGKNAYHYAATSTPEIMSALLQHPGRAAVDAFCEVRRDAASPLCLALSAGNRPMAELLLDYGCDVNQQDSYGGTPLHYLLSHRRSREEAMPLVRLLIDRGADIDAKAANYWDETPLFAAVRDSFTEAVTLLLDLGCDAAQQNHLGETLLHAAAKTYDAKNVRMLLDHGAKLDAQNNIGRTALHIAAHENKLDVVKTLLDAGADPYIKDKNGKTPDELCPADFQKNVHREILRKQMEVDSRDMTRDYYARQRQHKQQQGQNRFSRPFGNRR